MWVTGTGNADSLPIALHRCDRTIIDDGHAVFGYQIGQRICEFRHATFDTIPCRAGPFWFIEIEPVADSFHKGLVKKPGAPWEVNEYVTDTFAIDYSNSRIKRLGFFCPLIRPLRRTAKLSMIDALAKY